MNWFLFADSIKEIWDDALEQPAPTWDTEPWTMVLMLIIIIAFIIGMCSKK